MLEFLGIGDFLFLILGFSVLYGEFFRMFVKMCMEVGVFIKYMELLGIFKCFVFVSLLLIDIISVEVVIELVSKFV